MNTEYTSGPWICHSGMVWKQDGTEDGIPIARMDRNTSRTIPTERDKNARLIAAAPDLLEALRFMVNAAKTETGMDIYKAHIEQAENAIRKAIGE